MQRLFITGIGSGLGEALAHRFVKEGWHIYAVGRHCPRELAVHPNVSFLTCDLSNPAHINTQLVPFVSKQSFDLAVLNAGMLGDIKPLVHTSFEELETVMRLNVWANKAVIDALCAHTRTRHIVAISSGAAINGSKGWGSYAISKAALNMLLKVYAKECESTHFTALAPGVIDTPMVRYIINDVDENIYPSAARLKRGPIQTPQEAAVRLYETFPKLLAYESGSFLDVRKMDS